MQAAPASTTSDAALHTSTVRSDCQTSTIPMPGIVLLLLPSKVHELHCIHFSLLSFPIEICPFRPVFVGACLCVSHPLLGGHTCCRMKSSKALRKEELSMSPAVLPDTLGWRREYEKEAGIWLLSPLRFAVARGNPHCWRTQPHAVL